MHALIKGCKCATGCHTNRCGCRRKNSECSAGCECTNCANTAESITTQDDCTTDLENLAMEEVSVDDIVEFVFGTDTEYNEEIYADNLSDYEENNSDYDL